MDKFIKIKRSNDLPKHNHTPGVPVHAFAPATASECEHTTPRNSRRESVLQMPACTNTHTHGRILCALVSREDRLIDVHEDDIPK